MSQPVQPEGHYSIIDRDQNGELVILFAESIFPEIQKAFVEGDVVEWIISADPPQLIGRKVASFPSITRSQINKETV